MIYYFSWIKIFEQLAPYAKSDHLNDDGNNLLTCLLMDDGGIPYTESISWLEEGLNRIEQIKNNNAKLQAWDREAWGAIISPTQVKIYSLYDEEYCDHLSLNAFEKVLSAWKDFLGSTPNPNKHIEIELN